ncbi:hypothetical protein [Winogradskya humida]|nr:hypothetical protein [Actinoplanes humidus]
MRTWMAQRATWLDSTAGWGGGGTTPPPGGSCTARPRITSCAAG